MAVPTDYSGLVAWYDFSDTATITDAGGGAVSQVTDKSGTGRTIKQATGGARPTTGTRTINSLNVLDFDAGDHLLADNFDVNLHTTKAATLFIVHACDDVVGIGGGLLTFKRSSVRDYISLVTQRYQTEVNATIGTNSGINSASEYLSRSFTSSSTSAMMLTVIVDQGTADERFRLNGANQTLAGGIGGGSMAVSNYMTSGNTGLHKIIVGARGTAADNNIDIQFNGVIGEIAAFNVLLTATQISHLETSLGIKWGLTLADVVYDASPVVAAVVVPTPVIAGATITVTPAVVTAVASVPAPTIRLPAVPAVVTGAVVIPTPTIKRSDTALPQVVTVSAIVPTPNDFLFDHIINPETVDGAD